MSIVTGTGDDGSSSLFGGRRVPKHHPRLEAYGSVDEAQCAIGMVRSAGEIPEHLDTLLASIQKGLFTVGSDLASPDPEAKGPRVTSTMIRTLEIECEKLEHNLPSLKHFIIPCGTAPAATCFWARTVVRRAERRIADILYSKQLTTGENDVSTILVYLNRLSDLLFLISRALNSSAGFVEDGWSGKD